MKKIFILLIIFLLVGCTNSWENVVGISSVKYENGYIVGKIQNKTDKFYSVVIHFNGKNGSISSNRVCFVDLKPKEITDLSCLSYDYNEDYAIEIEKIEYKEKEIPKMPVDSKDDVELTKEQLEYYYKKIYDSHLYTYTSVLLYDNDSYNDMSEYPHIDKVKLKNGEITITYNAKFNNSNCFLYEVYLAKDEKMKILAVTLNENTRKLDSLISNFSNSDFITENSNIYASIEVRNKLIDSDSIGKRWSIGNIDFTREQRDGEVTLLALYNTH